jgi:hypothetical protein
VVCGSFYEGPAVADDPVARHRSRVPPSEAPPFEPPQTETPHVDGTPLESKSTGSEVSSASEKGSASAEPPEPKMIAQLADAVARGDQHTAVFFKIRLGGERAMAGHDLGVVVGGLVVSGPRYHRSSSATAAG